MARRHLQDAHHLSVVRAYYETDQENLLSPVLAELRPRLIAFLHKKKVDWGQVDDLVQDTLTDVLTMLRARQYAFAGTVCAWASEICWHNFSRGTRIKSRHITRPGMSEDPFLLLSDLLAIPAQLPPDCQEEEAQAAAVVQASTQAVLTLDPNARAAVVLHYYQGLPLPEAAARLGLDEQQYRSRLNRGLAKLRAWGKGQAHPSAEVYATLRRLDTGDLFTEPLRLAG